MKAQIAELRSFDGETGAFEVAAVTYGTIDTHGTEWAPGVFTESVRKKMPTAHFGHVDDPARLIAEFVDYRDEPDQFVLIGQMAPPQRSNWVRRAWAGLRDRILTDFSVVFTRQDTRRAPDGHEVFTRAMLHRVDLVLDGSVPGAQLLSFRNAHALGPVAERLAAAERAAQASGLWTPTPSASLRSVDETLAALEDY